MKYGILLTALLFTTSLLGHDVSHSILRNGYGVEFHYEDGNPLDFADVQIFRPGESEMEFQIGMTDENGIFMFNPDTLGSWTVKVSDGLGHGKIVQVEVGETISGVVNEKSLPPLQKAIVGLGYILFVFSIWYLIVKRRQEQHAHS
ncbi:MAG: hypothetical protein K9N35_03395 [Candidatus Marinimicrobia bacterium]|nr:hypothetical protein [Candidatus Neomarinimicrobiota bacterium]